MIILKEYKVDDWKKVDDAIEPFVSKVPIKDFLEMSQRGIAVTGTRNGKILACGGIAYFSDKEGIAWLKASRKCFGHPIEWARAIKETFKLMKESVGDLNISLYILSDFCKGEKLARLIGMKKTDETEEFKGNIYSKYMAVT